MGNKGIQKVLNHWNYIFCFYTNNKVAVARIILTTLIYAHIAVGKIDEITNILIIQSLQ